MSTALAKSIWFSAYDRLVPPRSTVEDAKKRAPDPAPGAGAALAVGAAIGTVLLLLVAVIIIPYLASQFRTQEGHT